MNIGIYNPYFDSYGGGERYTLTIAEHWSKTNDVSLFWNDPKMKGEAEKRFSLDLSRVKTVENIFANHRLFRKLIESNAYDLIFFLSDGSIPMSLARYNIIHFQVPFAHADLSSWKQHRYQRIVCNSAFTKEHLDRTLLKIPTDVIYPPVDISHFTPGEKTKTILSVGRFSSGYGAKKQTILIDAFKEFSKKNPGWELIFAGSILPADEPYMQKLKDEAKGFPVSFHPNCPFTTLQDLYAHARFYWHAAGFGETDPEHMEHFGITTVEAMAAGCVPISYNGGGQPEIINDNRDGRLWKTPEELIRMTMDLIGDRKTYTSMVMQAQKGAERFSKQKFTEKLDGLLMSVCGKTS